MIDDPLESVYGLVERAYIRLQAGDVLVQCLEEGNTNPMQKMVESLVLAGPESLSALREISAEIGVRKTQLQTDSDQIYADLEGKLKHYGVSLKGLHSPISLLRLDAIAFLALLRSQDVHQEDIQMECLRLLQDSRELLQSLARQRGLLDEADYYLHDWLWGIMYQFARQELADGLMNSASSKWPH